MSAISNNQIAQAIYSVSKDKSSAEQHAIFSKIIQFLYRKHLLSKTPNILSALEKIINHEEGRTIVKVSSAEVLQEKTKEYLVQTLKKRYSAKEIVLVPTLDSRLLGGMRLEINDEVIDFSIKNKIRKLQEYLTRNA